LVQSRAKASHIQRVTRLSNKTLKMPLKNVGAEHALGEFVLDPHGFEHKKAVCVQGNAEFLFTNEDFQYADGVFEYANEDFEHGNAYFE